MPILELIFRPLQSNFRWMCNTNECWAKAHTCSTLFRVRCGDLGAAIGNKRLNSTGSRLLSTACGWINQLKATSHQFCSVCVNNNNKKPNNEYYHYQQPFQARNNHHQIHSISSNTPKCPLCILMLQHRSSYDFQKLFVWIFGSLQRQKSGDRSIYLVIGLQAGWELQS